MSSNHYHQSVDEIIKSSNPNQRILWNDIFLLFGENIAVKQLNYMGPFAGSEFATYSASKYYFCYNFKAVSTAGTTNVLGNVALFNQVNAIYYYFINGNAIWQAVAAAVFYCDNDMINNDFLFSRLTMQNFNFLHFIGFRITR